MTERDKRHEVGMPSVSAHGLPAHGDDFVLEKHIFSNIFEKDIKRVFIYKRAERLAKAIQLVAPAFKDTPALHERIAIIAVRLIDSAVLPPAASRPALARELLTLSSALAMARMGGILSPMNAELIAKEARSLLQEAATYEEPRVFLEDAPTLAEIVGRVKRGTARGRPAPAAARPPRAKASQGQGHIKDTPQQSQGIKDRRETILSVIARKADGVRIKDISTVIRGVSEKTIQRELSALLSEGAVIKRGERRWSTYYLP